MHHFRLNGSEATRIGEPSPQPLQLSLPEIEKLKARYDSETFRGGLCLDLQRQRLYSLETNAGRLLIEPVDDAVEVVTSTEENRRILEIGGRPYDIKLGEGGRLAYVSDWAGARIVVVDAGQLQVVDDR